MTLTQISLNRLDVIQTKLKKARNEVTARNVPKGQGHPWFFFFYILLTHRILDGQNDKSPISW